MPAYRVTLAYDGTDFAGWQKQANSGAAAARTVQGVFEETLGRLADGERVAVAGAGRTDAGVHALGQVASFALDRDLPPPDLQRALNALLPSDVRVLQAARASEGFHARRSAVSKHYRYVLDTGPLQLPTRRRFAGHVPFRLDPDAVRETAALYLGRQDFASVASAGGSVLTTVRTVLRSEVALLAAGAPADAVTCAPTLVYDVEADGFLRKMVRSLVGGLVAVGRGAVTVADLRHALAARDRRRWPAPVDGRGLVLLSVSYPESDPVT